MLQQVPLPQQASCSELYLPQAQSSGHLGLSNARFSPVRVQSRKTRCHLLPRILLEEVVISMCQSFRAITFRFDGKTQWQMLLLLYGRHASAHVGVFASLRLFHSQFHIATHSKQLALTQISSCIDNSNPSMFQFKINCPILYTRDKLLRAKIIENDESQLCGARQTRPFVLEPPPCLLGELFVTCPRYLLRTILKYMHLTPKSDPSPDRTPLLHLYYS